MYLDYTVLLRSHVSPHFTILKLKSINGSSPSFTSHIKRIKWLLFHLNHQKTIGFSMNSGGLKLVNSLKLASC